MFHNNIKVLIIGKVWPEPNSSAAGSRMMQLIELFKAWGWSVTFATAAKKSEFAADLEGIGAGSVSIQLNDASFDEYISALNPNIVLFDRFMTEEQFGWRVAEQNPDALRILDTEDLHCLREARYTALKEERNFEEPDLFNRYAKREIASILRCDLSLIISSYEMNLLKQVFRIDENLIVFLPFMLESISEEDVINWAPYNKRDHFISIGNFLHEPNWDSVLYLKQTIWPLIREKIPAVEFHIYGAYTSQKVEQLHDAGNGFLIKGRAKDAKKVVSNARVLLAPLRFGAGLKGKLIEAMQCGTPSVTTEVGAEAMYADLSWPGFIENDPQSFADKAVELYKDESKWNDAQQNGIKIINRLYPKQELGERLFQRIQQIQANLTSHRQSNFMGEILHYHTVASTKYMSKWIEEKNKF